MSDNVNVTNENVVEQDFVINDVAPDDCSKVTPDANDVVNEVSEAVPDSDKEKVEAYSDKPTNQKPITPEEENPTAMELDASETKEDSTATATLLCSLQEQFSRMEEKFDKKIAEDTHKNALFDKMYDELARYKKDLYAKLVGPFVNETISLMDDYERLIDKIDSMDKDKIVKYIKGIPDDLESLLDNNGVDRYIDETEKFNPKTQRVVKTIATGDKALDNIIAERVRKGYRWNGVMLKPEIVKIYKYKEGYVSPEESPKDCGSQETAASTSEGVVSIPNQEQ